PTAGPPPAAHAGAAPPAPRRPPARPDPDDVATVLVPVLEVSPEALARLRAGDPPRRDPQRQLETDRIPRVVPTPDAPPLAPEPSSAGPRRGGGFTEGIERPEELIQAHRRARPYYVPEAPGPSAPAGPPARDANEA